MCRTYACIRATHEDIIEGKSGRIPTHWVTRHHKPLQLFGSYNVLVGIVNITLPNEKKY